MCCIDRTGTRAVVDCYISRTGTGTIVDCQCLRFLSFISFFEISSDNDAKRSHSNAP